MIKTVTSPSSLSIVFDGETDVEPVMVEDAGEIVEENGASIVIVMLGLRELLAGILGDDGIGESALDFDRELDAIVFKDELLVVDSNLCGSLAVTDCWVNLDVAWVEVVVEKSVLVSSYSFSAA